MTTNNAVDNLDNFVGFSAFLGADMELATGSGNEVSMIYDTVIGVKDCAYNNSNGVFTCTSSGVYDFTSVVHYQIDENAISPFSNNTFQSRIKVFSQSGIIYYFNACFNMCGDQNLDNDFQPQYLINKTGPILLSKGDTVYTTIFGDNAAGGINNIDILYSLGTYPPGGFQKACTFFSGFKAGEL